MEQHLRLYRNHTPACTLGLTKPVYEDEIVVPECSCPINARGYLRNHVDSDGDMILIRHRTLGKANAPVKEWTEARVIKANWIEWGNFNPPETDLEKITDPTVEQAVQAFLTYTKQVEERADATREKYEVFFNRRLLPWCKSHGKHFVRAFDNPIVVQNFYASWTNLQPVRGKAIVQSSNVQLAVKTKINELERYRTFLEFCRGRKWLGSNFAKSPRSGGSIKTPRTPRVQGKTGFNEHEWGNITKVLDSWKERYFNTNQGHKERQRAFAWACRMLGLRLVDVTMLGPHSITTLKDEYFIKAKLIKNGSEVMIPLDSDLHQMFLTLPVYGHTEKPVTLKRAHGEIKYGTSFWFWSANVPEDASDTKLNQVVESAAKNWSDDLTAVLKKTEEEYGAFENYSTPHCFRHSFAITALTQVDIEQVAAWLGDTVETVQRHYKNANSDYHKQSTAKMNKIKAALKGGKKAKPTRDVVVFPKSA